LERRFGVKAVFGGGLKARAARSPGAVFAAEAVS
jgi:hypothetical protein